MHVLRQLIAVASAFVDRLRSRPHAPLARPSSKTTEEAFDE